MLKFPSINSFRHAVASVKRACDYHRLPYPKIRYAGRVKLHGTNAGIVIDFNKKEISAQSRERMLTVDADNAGFAKWVQENQTELYNFFKELFCVAACSDRKNSGKITIYGEWCGPGIQKNTALVQMPERQFVVFNIAYHDTIVEHANSVDVKIYPIAVPRKTDVVVRQLRFIEEVDPVFLEIDFNQPDLAVDALQQLTQQYEDECPWGKLNGISGIGEGLVWAPDVPDSIRIESFMPYEQQHRLWFKTKGEKHGNKGTKNTVKVAVTAEKIEDFNALIEQILPAWRLEQGLSKVKETVGEPTRQQTGDFIKWVVGDVHKEELDTVEASEFEWKVVAGELSKRVRNWFLERV